MERNQFSQFAELLRRMGAAGVGLPDFNLGSDGEYRLKYIPFEHVNKDARLVIVGITPGTTQLELAYAAAQSLLQKGRPEAETLLEVKKGGAFGGPSMKPNLLKILRHFQFEKLLKIDDVDSLWGQHALLLHATSVVPHAAFVTRRSEEAMFAGSFGDVQGSDLLRECFEDCFVPSVREMNPAAMFVGLGPCPQKALEWCVERGYLRNEQVLGSFCHPSSSGGSTTKYYLREVSRSDLKQKDPVRFRCDWLDEAYEQMQASTIAHGAGPRMTGIRESAPTAVIPVAATTIAKVASPKKVLAPPPTTDDINAILEEFTRARYGHTNKSLKLEGFTSPGGASVYLVKTSSRRNRINVMVHPNLKAEFLRRLDGTEAVSEEQRFHSNMPRFPKRLNKGKTETTYGRLVTFGSLGDFARFLTAFRNVQ